MGDSKRLVCERIAQVSDGVWQTRNVAVRKWKRENDGSQSSMSAAQQTAARCTVVKRLEDRRSPKGDVNLAVKEGGRVVSETREHSS